MKRTERNKTTKKKTEENKKLVISSAGFFLKTTTKSRVWHAHTHSVDVCMGDEQQMNAHSMTT